MMYSNQNSSSTSGKRYISLSISFSSSKRVSNNRCNKCTQPISKSFKLSWSKFQGKTLSLSRSYLMSI